MIFTWKNGFIKQQVNQNGSVWVGICSVNFGNNELLESMIEGIRLELEDGTKVRFWRDRWLEGSILILFLVKPKRLSC